MLDVMERKIKQMHAALGAMSSADVLAVVPEVKATDSFKSIGIDFNKGSDPVDLANAASLLISNIASLKDHLKAWCRKHGLPFKGDALINSHPSVALVHDLWNVDKHAELTSAPRSGHVPKIVGLSKALALTTGTEANASVMYQMDPRTGEVTVQTSGSGAASIRISGQIVDDAGTVLGDFHQTCVEAIDAWQQELSAVGVPTV